MFFPRVNQPRREIDHSCSSSAEITNKWKYTSTPPTCLHDVDRDKATRFLVSHLQRVLLQKLNFCLACISSNTFEFIVKLRVNLCWDFVGKRKDNIKIYLAEIEWNVME